MKINFLVGTLLFGGILSANTVVPPGTGLWQTSSTAPSGNVYWNNSPSDDYGCGNIGDFIAKTSCFSSNANSPDWDSSVYLGNGDGTAVQDFYFNGGSSTTIQAEVAGFQNNNWLGWYETDSSGNRVASGSFGVIFDGAASVNAFASFTPTANYGLWFLSNYAGVIGGIDQALLTSKAKFTTSSSNTEAAGQYFTVFAESEAAATTTPVTYYIGIEDANFPGGDHDYQDMIISLTVPEPGFYGVLALGFVGLGLVRRRRS